MRAAWFLLFAGVAFAQTASTDPTGSISGVVTDAVTHLPLKKTMVSVAPMGPRAPGQQGPQATTTDAGGTFTIGNLQDGEYMLMFQNQNYPQTGGFSKRVEVKAGEASQANMELMPGAVLTGLVTDEDGDPLKGCFVQLHPPGSSLQGVPMRGTSPSNDDGEYRLFGAAPGKYLVSVQCYQPVFQARPFSSGPDPPPSRAYPMEYYPLTTEPKSAQTVELTAGTEKSGVDFQMTPSAVTQIYGAFSPAGADWHGSGNQLSVQLISPDGRNVNMGSSFDRVKGTFEFRQVFPGSYTVVAMTYGDEEDRVGVWQKVDVANQPLHLTVELKHAMDLSGKVEIEGNTNNTNQNNPNRNNPAPQIQIALRPATRIGMPATQTQANQDGTFTLKGVLPAPWHLMAYGPNMFIKSAWLGSTDVTGAPIDLSNGAAAALRVVLSTNTATIHGSAPAGQVVRAELVTDDPFSRNSRATGVDQNGQYKLQGLAPGTYRLTVGDPSGPMPAEGGQEITVHEGEAAMLDLKAPQTP